MLHRILILVPFLGLSCVSTPEFDVDLRFDDTRKNINAANDKNQEQPDLAYRAFSRLDYGMSFEHVRAIFNREPSRNVVRDNGRSCSWSFDGGSGANIEFDAKNKLTHMIYVPRL